MKTVGPALAQRGGPQLRGRETRTDSVSWRDRVVPGLIHGDPDPFFGVVMSERFPAKRENYTARFEFSVEFPQDRLAAAPRWLSFHRRLRSLPALR